MKPCLGWQLRIKTFWSRASRLDDLSSALLSGCTMLSPDPTELSSNRSTILHTSRQCVDSPHRHPELCFNDGNMVILAGSVYFVVHKGPLGRHSPVLERLIQDLPGKSSDVIEDLPVLAVPYNPAEICCFLRTLYGCVCLNDLPASTLVTLS